jgi:MFS family permease
MLMIPLIAIATLVVLGRFEPAGHRTGGTDDNSPAFARPTLAIMALVMICMPAMILEGASIDWSAIYMTKEFLATPFWAGFAVALAAGAQAITRFFADSFVERWSPMTVARCLLAILGAGAVLVFFAPAPWMAYLGLALVGVGGSALFPLAMSAAAQRTDRAASVNVAALAQISFVSFLLGPPLLGYVAEHFGIRWAFGIGVPLVVIGLLFSDRLGGGRQTRPIPAE